jgi:hypothetical protein
MTTTAYTVFTGRDRCDRCNAPAKVRVLLRTGGELLFCGHHASKHAPRLHEIGARLSFAP